MDFKVTPIIEMTAECRDRIAVGPQDSRAFGNAARGQRNVCRDGDIPGLDMIGNPIVRCVGAIAQDNGVDQRIKMRTNASIADDANMKAVAAGHLLHFGLHWTGVCLDIDLKCARPLFLRNL